MLSFPSVWLYIGFAESFIWKVCMDFDFVDMLTFFCCCYILLTAELSTIDLPHAKSAAKMENWNLDLIFSENWKNF